MTIWGNPFSTHVTRPDYAQTDETLADYIRNKPDAAIQKAQTTADNAKTAADNAKTAADAALAAAQNAHTAAQTALAASVSLDTREVVLAAGQWSDGQQTVAVEPVTAQSTLLISPAPSALEAFPDYGIACVSQGSGTLTFRCGDTPGEDITVCVLILENAVRETAV